MTKYNSTYIANRRQFLKLSSNILGLAFIAPLVPALSLASVPSIDTRKRYQGTADGKVFMSLDQGKTWNRIGDFGADCKIEKIVADAQGLVTAHLITGQHRFSLATKNDRTWISTGYDLAAYV